jgi:hypothetical protein
MTSSAALIDDALVLRLLQGSEAPSDLPLHTTYCWWWRLGAALRARRGGRLSRPLLTGSDAQQALLIAAVERLPEIVRIEDPRALLSLAADLHRRFGLQLLAAEAAATALTVDASIFVAVDNPKLAGAAAALGVPYEVVGPGVGVPEGEPTE